MATNTALGGFLIACFAIGLVINILALVVRFSRKRIRKPQLFLCIHLVLVDIIALMTWTPISSVFAMTGGAIDSPLCDVIGYVKEFCSIINMHSLLIIALERAIKIFKPSKHDVIFIDTVVILLLCAVYVFDIVNAAFPFTGWGRFIFFPSQFQCTSDTVASPSHMNFMFVVTYCVPILGMLICYFAIWNQVRKLRRRISHAGPTILEENSRAVGDSYSDRLRRTQEKFNMAGMRENVVSNWPKTKQFNTDGDESDSSSSSDDESYTKDRPQIKRQYHLSEYDLALTKIYALASFVYVSLWLPYVITTYVFTYDQNGATSDLAFAIVVCLTHISCFIKPIIFMCHSKFRKGFVRAMRRKNTENAVS